ncbi:MAG TPA: hypothetical protein VJ904_00895 [Tichowtungia sp.]|nr:hypothetical protein [Tichowtungia sp.]
MRKLITLVAFVVLAAGDFALADNCAKKSCCGTCKKGEAVEQSCSKEKSCGKKTEGCAKKAGGCAKGAAAQKSQCAK